MPPRLTRARWIEEGLAALRRDGPPGLAADRLAKKLGVSRGSFYWHFASAPDFEAAVLGEWEQRWTTRIIDAVEKGGGDPRSRLKSLIERTGGEDAGLYAAAKRMAQRHKELAELMRRVDAHRIRFVADILVSAGLDEAVALLRARIIYSWAMGQMLIGESGKGVDPSLAACLTAFAFQPAGGEAPPSRSGRSGK